MPLLWLLRVSILYMLTFFKWSLRVFEEQWIANNAYISAQYPQLNFDVMKEIRALHLDVRTIDENHHVLIFRLPESDQVKSNVKRVTVDYGVFQKILEEDFYEQEMTMQVSSFWSNHIKRSTRGKVKTYLKLCHFGKFCALVGGLMVMMMFIVHLEVVQGLRCFGPITGSAVPLAMLIWNSGPNNWRIFAFWALWAKRVLHTRKQVLGPGLDFEFPG